MTYTRFLYISLPYKNIQCYKPYSLIQAQISTEYPNRLNTKQIIELKSYGHIQKYQCMHQIHDLNGHVYYILYACHTNVLQCRQYY